MPNSIYYSRDLSWLSFNHRVLQEARDPRVPLYEKIKFLAIYSSNLDEFYRVRVSALRSFKSLKKETRREFALKPKKELRQIRAIVEQQQREFGSIFRELIIPDLERNGIRLLRTENFSEAQQAFAMQYFRDQVLPHIHFFELATGSPAPFLKNKGLYFIAVTAETPAKLYLIEMPVGPCPRFVELPGSGDGFDITFLDDIIRLNLQELLGEPVDDAFAIKMSRDAEMYIDDEYSGDLIEKIKMGLIERNMGAPTRFLYDNRMPETLRMQLKALFDLGKNEMIPGARYHNFNDFFSFPNPGNNPALHYRIWPPLPHPELEKAASVMQAMSERDYLLHLPYQRFDYVSRLIREAAEDASVTTIKITLYRAASKSEIVEALIGACERGKDVTVFIEAKARFDEASNLYWGEQLEKAGASVHYSYPGIKVHCKLLLIGCAESSAVPRYGYIGTGNFNEKTAVLYTDHALLTCHPKLTAEVGQVFDLLSRRIILPRCKALLVAPFTMREGFIERIDREIEHARENRPAYMILKMNSLEDRGMIAKLYEASRAGVRIRIIVRGICCLIPGVPGMSENINVTSIVDRFLEHARIYLFGNGGKEELFIASADWMTRNLDRRIEVATPILDPVLFDELRKILGFQLDDNVKARIIDEVQSNPHVERQAGEPDVRAQESSYTFLKRKSETV